MFNERGSFGWCSVTRSYSCTNGMRMKRATYSESRSKTRELFKPVTEWKTFFHESIPYYRRIRTKYTSKVDNVFMVETTGSDCKDWKSFTGRKFQWLVIRMSFQFYIFFRQTRSPDVLSSVLKSNKRVPIPQVWSVAKLYQMCNHAPNRAGRKFMQELLLGQSFDENWPLASYMVPN